VTLRLQTFAQGNIWLHVPSTSNGQAGDLHRIRLELQERRCRAAEHRTGTDGGYRLSSFQGCRLIKVLHDPGLELGRIRLAAFRAESDLLHAFLEEGDASLSTARGGELEKELLVAFDDDDETGVTEPECFLSLEAIQISDGDDHLCVSALFG
jgi:hypothetical protein